MRYGIEHPRTALITGASRGLGLELARALAAQNWSLIVTARTPIAPASIVESPADAARITVVTGDISHAAHREDIAEAAQSLGGLDVVINNAASLGASPLPALLDYPLPALESLLRVNVIAPLALLQAVKPFLRENARIVNITSDAAVEAYPGWGGYGMSKAALEAWSAVLAAENPSWRVYRVDPGDMRTQMHQDAFPGEDISDRPLPETSVLGILRLLTDDLPGGRYVARDPQLLEGGHRE